MNFDAILGASQSDWSRVGPDFEARMSAMAGQGAHTEDAKVIPFPSGDYEGEPSSDWARVRLQLKAADPARFAAWFAPLAQERIKGGILVLRAPSRFHAEYVETHLVGEILRALAEIPEAPRTVVIKGPEEGQGS